MNVEGCLACDANAGRIEVPGGTIAETEHWHADHCIGPFGVGAVVVKTKEHVESLWRLPDGRQMSSGRSCGESPARSSTGWVPSART